MKKILPFLKYLLFGIVGLLFIVSLGLLLYYQSIYKEDPLPVAVAAKPALKASIALTDKPTLLPIPQKLEWQTGSFALSKTITFDAPKEDVALIKKSIQNRMEVSAQRGAGAFTFSKNKVLQAQAYNLTITPYAVRIEYNDALGLVYALTTVKQLAHQSANHLPCVRIEDHPDLAIRGAMLDISRGKVPKLETLYQMVDFLADLKYNHLQLYIEGFSFAYPSFKSLWEKTETPITPEEIKKLDQYCKDRFIELVPNQNALGHMQDWLKTNEYKDLAECPEGYKLMGLIEMKTTMSPTNPKTLALVEKMSEDLLLNFTSDKYNVNLDEPFELGKSKTRPISDPKEVAKLFMDYTKKLQAYVKGKNRTMMMWGDLISRNPEIISEIPKDIMLLEWRYDHRQDFSKICQVYQQAGLHYMVCPGTGSWSSYTGRMDNMIGNVENAVENGIKYGASGMLITDWGDTPHLQYLTVSYPGLAYGAALSWNYKSKDEVSPGNYLSKAVFGDAVHRPANIMIEMGRYNQFEEYDMTAMTTTNMVTRFGVMDKLMTDAVKKRMQKGIVELMPSDDPLINSLTDAFAHPKVYNAKAIIHFSDSLEEQLLKTHLNMPDSALVISEYKNAIQMIRLAAKLKHYTIYHQQQTDDENKVLLAEIKSLCAEVTAEHERLWMIRNKRSGFEGSVAGYKSLEMQIDRELNVLNSNVVSRWFSRALDKMKTAAAVLYLKYS